MRRGSDGMRLGVRTRRRRGAIIAFLRSCHR